MAPYLDSPLLMFEAGEESSLHLKPRRNCKRDDVFACENMERNFPLRPQGGKVPCDVK